MTHRVRLLGVETLFSGWGQLTRATLDYLSPDGTPHRMTRENYDHGNAAAVLLLDPARRRVLLVRQYRYPVDANGDAPFLLECCAGLLDGDDPSTCAGREALEESGHEARNLTHIGDVYMSPGSVQEKTSLFLGEYDDSTQRHNGGGLAAEGEFIELVEMGLDEALVAIAEGAIVDGKTIILLQHARLKELERKA